MRHFVTSVGFTLLAPFVLVVLGASALAGDPNGYRAAYECRAGGAICGIDVVALGHRTCDQIIAPSTSWSQINWSNRTICIEAGDHTHKGPLTVPSSASGSPENYKVLRYYRQGDTDDDPWHQASGEQARLYRLVVDGADYLLVHRLAFPAVRSHFPYDYRVETMGTATNNIFDRLLIEGAAIGSGTAIYAGIGNIGSRGTMRNTTIQNSVIRNNNNMRGSDGVGVASELGSDIRIVNNEIYDWSSHPVQFGYNGQPQIPGIVVENNDIYFTEALRVSGGRLAAEGTLVFKAYGAQSNPIRVLHNRIWGNRYTDTSTCCIGGTDGKAISMTPPDFENDYQRWTLIQNNILMENQKGVQWSIGRNFNTSVIGNIFYKQRRYSSDESGAVEMYAAGSTEVYLNTFIDNEQFHISYIDGRGNNDIRCNAFIASGSMYGSASSAFVDNNAFYGVSKLTANGDDHNVVHGIRKRAASSSYAAGEIVATGDAAQCSNPSDPACYLYKVVSGGTSASGSAPYCTSLGCTMTDGSVTLQAVRGPFAFKRRVRTSPEQYVIPYARVHSSASETHACPGDFASRRNIGINDDG